MTSSRPTKKRKSSGKKLAKERMQSPEQAEELIYSVKHMTDTTTFTDDGRLRPSKTMADVAEHFGASRMSSPEVKQAQTDLNNILRKDLDRVQINADVRKAVERFDSLYQDWMPFAPQPTSRLSVALTFLALGMLLGIALFYRLWQMGDLS